MQPHHWLTIFVAVVAGIFLQKYLNVTSKVGLG